MKTLSKKLPISKVKSILKSNSKSNIDIVLTQNHQMWNFNVAELLYIYSKDWKNALKFLKMTKMFKLWGDWKILWPKICLFWQSDQMFGIKQKNRVNLDRNRQIWYLIVCTFHCYWQIFVSLRETGLHLGYISTQIWDSFNVFYFLKVLRLKSLSNSRRNLYEKSVVLDIKLLLLVVKWTCILTL